MYRRDHHSNQSCDAELETTSQRSLDVMSKVDWTVSTVHVCDNRNGRRHKYSVSFQEYAQQGAHIWTDYPSGDNCYLSEKDCVLGQVSFNLRIL